MKKVFIFAIFIIVFASLSCYLCGCGLDFGNENESNPKQEDTVSRCAISENIQHLSKVLLEKDNFHIVWESNKMKNENGEPYSWEYSVQSIGKKNEASGFQERVYRFTDYRGKTQIFHYYKSNQVVCYERSATSSKWFKYSTPYPQNIDSSMKELLSEGLLHKYNMGALCETPYFWVHSLRVDLLGVECQKLERQEEQNIVLYITSDKLCMKWEDVNDAAAGGRVSEYNQSVTIAIPIVAD